MFPAKVFIISPYAALYRKLHIMCIICQFSIILKSDIRGSNSFSKQKSTYFNVMREVQDSNKAVPGTHCI